MHELLEREDPYSYYRGQSQSFANITPRERVVKALLFGVPLASIVGLLYKWYLEAEAKKTEEPVEGAPMERQILTNWSGTQQVAKMHHPLLENLCLGQIRIILLLLLCGYCRQLQGGAERTSCLTSDSLTGFVSGAPHCR